ncbi:hypothetical protein Dimus_026756 [Dionaea muscipula]
MVGCSRGFSQRRTGDDGVASWSSVRRPVLGRGSPSPTIPHHRRGLPSPWIRPRRRRSPSPMRLSSPDPADLSSLEEMEPSEATLSPILEVGGLPEVSASPEFGSSPLSPTAAIILCRASMDVCGYTVVSLRTSSHLGMFGSGLTGRGEVADDASIVYRRRVDDSGDGVALVSSDFAQVALGADSGGHSATKEVLRCPIMANADLCIDSAKGFDSYLSLSAAIAVADGRTVCGAVKSTEISKGMADSLLHRLSDDVGNCGRGMVSEEGWVLPEARGALRPRPTDWLRQHLSSLVEPVSVVEGRVGQDGCSGGQSYAHVVQVNRRADVELSYLPPVGVGKTITMEESDGDKL